MNEPRSNSFDALSLMRVDTHAITGVILYVLQDTGNSDMVRVTAFNPEGVDIADKIFYTIQYNDPRGGVQLRPREVPVNPRWPAPMKVQPSKPGTGVHGVMMTFRNGSPPMVQFTIHELPGLKTCGPNTEPPTAPPSPNNQPTPFVPPGGGAA